MALTERSRAAFYEGLHAIIDDEEAIGEVLSNFPARDLDEPATRDQLRAEAADLRAEMRRPAAPDARDLRHRIAGMRRDLDTGLAGMRADLDTGLAGVRTEIATLEARPARRSPPCAPTWPRWSSGWWWPTTRRCGTP